MAEQDTDLCERIDSIGDTALALIDHLQANRNGLAVKLSDAQGDIEDLREILHDLVMLRAQRDIGCVPPPTLDQWEKAWRRAEELFEP